MLMISLRARHHETQLEFYTVVHELSRYKFSFVNYQILSGFKSTRFSFLLVKRQTFIRAVKLKQPNVEDMLDEVFLNGHDAYQKPSQVVMNILHHPILFPTNINSLSLSLSLSQFCCEYFPKN